MLKSEATSTAYLVTKLGSFFSAEERLQKLSEHVSDIGQYEVAIPESVYEAATMEGATGWESFWKVTFPMVSPYILINVVYSIVNSLSSSSSPVLGLILETARTGNVDLSLSAAMAFIFCGLELVILAIMVLIVSRIVFYYD